MTEINVKEKNISRRKFLLSGAGALAVGALSLAGCGTTQATSNTATTEGSGAAAALPWKYSKIDVEKVRKLGYDNYWKNGCMYGAAAALITAISETDGGAWKTIPLDMFGYGEGGAYGWGTLCGALNGGLAVMNLAAGKNPELGNDLMGWYTENPFPSDKHDAYCKVPKQVTSVSKSPLCHASVSKWVKTANSKVNSDERKDRCAKLTGDAAAKVAEMLNQALDSQYKSTFKPTQEYISCMGCHNGKTSTLDNEQGKMDCISCHDDHINGKK